MQEFGGSWTRQKLDALREYLAAYLTVFSSPRAQWFQTTYIDAFAGSGSYTYRGASEGDTLQFEEADANSMQQVFDGSAAIALGLEPGFNKFVFIERSPARLRQLQDRIAESGKERQCRVLQGDSNARLREIVESQDWAKVRAVCFLDPYGMQVDWSVVELLGRTQAVDLFFLFPVGAVIRMIPNEKPIPGEWQARLDQALGTKDWREAFFTPTGQQDLFEANDDHVVRTVTEQKVVEFVNARLRTCYAATASNPVRLANSRGAPLFYLFFASSNPKGAPIATRIVEAVFRKHSNG